MNKVNIKLLKTSKNYAAALYSAAKDLGATNSVLSDLNLVTTTIEENIELYRFLDNPVISINDKKSAIAEIFQNRISENSLNFLYILAENSRFSIIGDILREYKEISDIDNNIIKINAISAVPLQEYLKLKLQTKLETLMAKKVDITYEINPEIIGGLIIKTDEKTMDNSVLTKLNKIKKQLI